MISSEVPFVQALALECVCITGSDVLFGTLMSNKRCYTHAYVSQASLVSPVPLAIIDSSNANLHAQWPWTPSISMLQEDKKSMICKGRHAQLSDWHA